MTAPPEPVPTLRPDRHDGTGGHDGTGEAPLDLSSDAVGPRLTWLPGEVLHDGVRERRFDVLRGRRRVPGLLWTPVAGEAPRPLVLLGHGVSGSKHQDYVLAMARRLARRHDIAAAAIDGPVHGDRRATPPAPRSLVLADFAQLWANDGDAMTDSMVADWRATLDELQSLPDVGSGPVAWWGLSMGTIIGLPVVAADDRVRVAVLGLMGLTGPTRARIARDAPTVRCPVLFFVQWDDSLFPHELAVELWEALGSRAKCLVANPGDHGDVPPEVLEASVGFLARHLATTGGGQPRPAAT